MTQANTQQASTARGGIPPAQAVQVRQYLTFTLGNEVFAIGILAIKEIIEYSTLTTVPMMPAYVRGVINLRGAVVPVLDLSVRFGKAPSPVTKKTCIVIIEMQSTGQTSRHDSQPVQLSALMIATSLGSFLRGPALAISKVLVGQDFTTRDWA